MGYRDSFLADARLACTGSLHSLGETFGLYARGVGAGH